MSQPSLFPAENGAEFSVDRVYRYALWRTWDKTKGHVMWIGLNPSTADETEDDPTIRRCQRFARDWGYGGIYMLNLFAYRATDPREMKAARDPEGPVNWYFLEIYAHAAERVMAAWGVHGAFRGQDSVAKRVIRGERWQLECLGHTKEGHPRHPLYVPANASPDIWTPDLFRTT